MVDAIGILVSSRDDVCSCVSVLSVVMSESEKVKLFSWVRWLSVTSC